VEEPPGVPIVATVAIVFIGGEVRRQEYTGAGIELESAPFQTKLTEVVTRIEPTQLSVSKELEMYTIPAPSSP
jgi:hypothetical protein